MAYRPYKSFTDEQLDEIERQHLELLRQHRSFEPEAAPLNQAAEEANNEQIRRRLSVQLKTKKITRTQYQEWLENWGLTRSRPPQQPSPLASDRDPPPLPPFFRRVLNQGHKGEDASHLVAFASICAGWKTDQLLAALADPTNQGGIGVQQIEIEKGKGAALDKVLRLQRRALAFAVDNPRRREECQTRCHIELIRQVADGLLWRTESEHTDLYVLHAVLDIAERVGNRRVSFSDRQLALAVGVSRDTANNARRRLGRLGWLRLVGDLPNDRTKAGKWEISVPQSAPRTRLVLPRPEPRIVSSGAFRRDALGKARFHVWRMASSREHGWSSDELAAILGIQQRTVQRHLRPLVALQFVVRTRDSHYLSEALTDDMLSEAEVSLGVIGKQAERRRRYHEESQRWREVAELLPPRHL